MRLLTTTAAHVGKLVLAYMSHGLQQEHASGGTDCCSHASFRDCRLLRLFCHMGGVPTSALRHLSQRRLQGTGGARCGRWSWQCSGKARRPQRFLPRTLSLQRPPPRSSEARQVLNQTTHLWLCCVQIQAVLASFLWL